MTEPDRYRVLMVYPLFTADSFWKYTEACDLVGARYPAAPLGLITVAAMLPKSWDIRLINRNTEELADADIDWADMVMTGGMLFQQADSLALIDRCHARGKPVVIGGPDATTSPQVYAAADFRVLGEVESVIDTFVEAWRSGTRKGVYTAEKFTIDVTKTPVPRFDLLKFDQYLHIGVQFSRGCPFTCEFCDIIELYGRVPRAKTTPQILAELEALYQLGYRGHVDFVDDNLIGNKKALKLLLPHLKQWIEAHDYPFEFSTEASVNLADDSELLEMLKQANFFIVFVGIESPDPATLVAMKKKQNTRRDIAESIHKIYQSGMMVTAGFIVGFDSEKLSIADAMVDFIEEAAIPACMVGLLHAVPNTQLTRRLERENRLHPNYHLQDDTGDQCTAGLNFDTLRPLRDVLLDYRSILVRVYQPEAYAGRLERLAGMLDRSGRPRDLPEGDVRLKHGHIEMVHKIISRMPEVRDVFWKCFVNCAQANPASVRYIVMLMAMYLHLGPFSKYIIAAIDRRLAEEDAAPRSVSRAAERQPAAAAVM